MVGGLNGTKRILPSNTLKMVTGNIKMEFIKMKAMNCGAGGGICMIIKKKKVIILMVKKRVHGFLGLIQELKVAKELLQKMNDLDYGFTTMKMVQ